MSALDSLAVFDLGLPSIDRDHRVIADLLGRIDAAIGERRSGDAPGLVDELFQSAMRHFAAEEQLMREFGYPGLVGHTGDHVHWLAQIRALADAVRGDGADSGEALTRVARFYSAEVNHCDHEFLRYLEREGALAQAVTLSVAMG